MRRVGKIEFTRHAVESTCNHGGQPERAVRLFIGEREDIIERAKQSGRVSNVLEFVQEMMDMPGDAAGRISVAHAISQYDPSEVVSARKHRGKITALVSVGRNRNHVAFQSSQFQRTVSALVTGPQFHTAERALVRRCTCELLAFDFLESHSSFDAEEPNPVTGRASLALFRPALGQLAMRGTVTPGATEAYKDRFSSYFGRAAPGTAPSITLPVLSCGVLLGSLRAGLNHAAGDACARVAGRISLVIVRSEEHTSELQSRLHLVCRLLLEKKKR